MSDPDESPPERLCANHECSSGDEPLPGYDDCETCTWETHLARAILEKDERIGSLETELAARRTDTGDLDAIIASPTHAFGERNAARAARAARRIGTDNGGAARVDRDEVVEALGDLLHCADGGGHYIDEVVAEALRQHGRDVAAEDREIAYWPHPRQATCGRCGGPVPRAGRWYERCRNCRVLHGPDQERISDDPGEANRQRAHLVEDALDAFAARTGQGEPIGHADNEIRSEVMGDFLCNLGHFADLYDLDFDQIATDGYELYRQELADVETDHDDHTEEGDDQHV
jgi:hypothetical protein